MIHLKYSTLLSLITLSILNPHLAHAQLFTSDLAPSALKEGGHSNNGGDPFELAELTGKNGSRLSSWYSVKMDLIQGLEMGRHHSINLYEWTPETFKEKLLYSLKSTAVEFRHEWIQVNGVDRPCKNYRIGEKNYRIQCNPAQYLPATEKLSIEEHVKFIAHEYMSAAELEPNRYGLSDFRFSEQISRNLEQVTVRRWATATPPSTTPVPEYCQTVPVLKQIFRILFDSAGVDETKLEVPFDQMGIFRAALTPYMIFDGKANLRISQIDWSKENQIHFLYSYCSQGNDRYVGRLTAYGNERVCLRRVETEVVSRCTKVPPKTDRRSRGRS